MDWNSLRRIVTDNDGDERSRILIDGEAAKIFAVGEAGVAEIWSAPVVAGQLLDATDKLADADIKLEPDVGSVKVRWFTVGPENDGRTADEKEMAAAMALTAIGAADCRVDTTRHPMMHKTDSLDVIILVKGSIDLLLDDDEAVSLKPGDVVIQRATNHAWVNHGDEAALLVAVLINAGAAK